MPHEPAIDSSIESSVTLCLRSCSASCKQAEKPACELHCEPLLDPSNWESCVTACVTDASAPCRHDCVWTCTANHTAAYGVSAPYVASDDYLVFSELWEANLSAVPDERRNQKRWNNHSMECYSNCSVRCTQPCFESAELLCKANVTEELGQSGLPERTFLSGEEVHPRTAALRTNECLLREAAACFSDCRDYCHTSCTNLSDPAVVARRERIADVRLYDTYVESCEQKCRLQIYGRNVTLEERCLAFYPGYREECMTNCTYRAVADCVMPNKTFTFKTFDDKHERIEPPDDTGSRIHWQRPWTRWDKPLEETFPSKLFPKGFDAWYMCNRTCTRRDHLPVYRKCTSNDTFCPQSAAQGGGATAGTAEGAGLAPAEERPSEDVAEPVEGTAGAAADGEAATAEAVPGDDTTGGDDADVTATTTSWLKTHLYEGYYDPTNFKTCMDECILNITDLSRQPIEVDGVRRRFLCDGGQAKREGEAALAAAQAAAILDGGVSLVEQREIDSIQESIPHSEMCEEVDNMCVYNVSRGREACAGGEGCALGDENYIPPRPRVRINGVSKIGSCDNQCEERVLFYRDLCIVKEQRNASFDYNITRCRHPDGWLVGEPIFRYWQRTNASDPLAAIPDKIRRAPRFTYDDVPDLTILNCSCHFHNGTYDPRFDAFRIASNMQPYQDHYVSQCSCLFNKTLGGPEHCVQSNHTFANEDLDEAFRTAVTGERPHGGHHPTDWIKDDFVWRGNGTKQKMVTVDHAGDLGRDFASCVSPSVPYCYEKCGYHMIEQFVDETSGNYSYVHHVNVTGPAGPGYRGRAQNDSALLVGDYFWYADPDCLTDCMVEYLYSIRNNCTDPYWSINIQQAAVGFAALSAKFTRTGYVPPAVNSCEGECKKHLEWPGREKKPFVEGTPQDDANNVTAAAFSCFDDAHNPAAEGEPYCLETCACHERCSHTCIGLMQKPSSFTSAHHYRPTSADHFDFYPVCVSNCTEVCTAEHHAVCRNLTLERYYASIPPPVNETLKCNAHITTTCDYHCFRYDALHGDVDRALDTNLTGNTTLFPKEKLPTELLSLDITVGDSSVTGYTCNIQMCPHPHPNPTCNETLVKVGERDEKVISLFGRYYEIPGTRRGTSDALIYCCVNMGKPNYDCESSDPKTCCPDGFSKEAHKDCKVMKHPDPLTGQMKVNFTTFDVFWNVSKDHYDDCIRNRSNTCLDTCRDFGNSVCNPGVDPFDTCVQSCVANLTYEEPLPEFEDNVAVCTKALRLTPSIEDRKGSAWHRDKQRVQAGFNTTFTFKLAYPSERCMGAGTGVGGGPGQAAYPNHEERPSTLDMLCEFRGGDGFAFVIQDSGATMLEPECVHGCVDECTANASQACTDACLSTCPDKVAYAEANCMTDCAHARSAQGDDAELVKAASACPSFVGGCMTACLGERSAGLEFSDGTAAQPGGCVYECIWKESSGPGGYCRELCPLVDEDLDWDCIDACTISRIKQGQGCLGACKTFCGPLTEAAMGLCADGCDGVEAVLPSGENVESCRQFAETHLPHVGSVCLTSCRHDDDACLSECARSPPGHTTDCVDVCPENSTSCVVSCLERREGMAESCMLPCVTLNCPHESVAIGEGSNGVGFEGVPNLLAVKFDTWFNAEAGDPLYNHIAVHASGPDFGTSTDVNDALGVTSDLPNLSDGKYHTVRIEYKAELSGPLDDSFSITPAGGRYLVPIGEAAAVTPDPRHGLVEAKLEKEAFQEGRHEKELHVLCNGMDKEDYCDCEADCVQNPSYCACAEAQACCTSFEKANGEGLSQSTKGTEALPHVRSHGPRKPADVHGLGELRVILDGKQVLKVAVNVGDVLKLDNGRAWVGFTGATGATYQEHTIAHWSWDEQPCSVKLNSRGLDLYSCGQDAVPPDLDACPVGWRLHGAKCYKIIGQGSQVACEATCAAAAPRSAPRAGLVCLESRDEEMFVERAFAGERSCCHWPTEGDESSDQSCCTWIGLYQDPQADHGTTGDPVGGWTHWRRPGCTSRFHGWAAGQPDQSGGHDEDCAMLFAWGKEGWFDHACEAEFRCLCEISANPHRSNACFDNSDCSNHKFCSLPPPDTTAGTLPLRPVQGRCVLCFEYWSDMAWEEPNLYEAVADVDGIDEFRSMSCAEHLSQDWEQPSRVNCEAACSRRPGGSGAQACGTSWGKYTLASSGAPDCAGCGRAITSYDDCLAAAAFGAGALGINGLGGSWGTWHGPPGCHIKDGQNFQFNSNLDVMGSDLGAGSRLRDGQPLRCPAGSRGDGGYCSCVGAPGWVAGEWLDPWCHEGKCYTGQAHAACEGRGAGYSGPLLTGEYGFDGTWCHDERRQTECPVSATSFVGPFLGRPGHTPVCVADPIPEESVVGV